jgi:hypothetical protein
MCYVASDGAGLANAVPGIHHDGGWTMKLSFTSAIDCGTAVVRRAFCHYAAKAAPTNTTSPAALKAGALFVR